MVWSIVAGERALDGPKQRGYVRLLMIRRRRGFGRAAEAKVQMYTDTELKAAGFRALVAALGDVQAEKFIALIQREPFDYTKWQRNLWPDKTVEELSRLAMTQRHAEQ